MREEFWSAICELEWLLEIAFGILTVLLVLALVSIVLVRPGTGSSVLSVINLLILTPLFGVCVYSIRRCRKRQSMRRSG